MSSLMKQVEQRRQLPKAGDADRDPADLSASPPASKAESISASEKADSTASTHASKGTGRNPGGKASRGAAKKDSTTRSQPATGSRPTRRVGRPKGPSRRGLSVRILTEIDDALTAAVADTQESPQYIVDAALTAWLTERGYLEHVS